MPAQPKLDPTSTIVLAPAVVSTAIPGEVVILDPTSDRYFSLEGVGAHVWARLQAGPATLGELTAAVVDEYEVDAATAERDLRALLDDLVGRGLVRAGGSPRA